MCCCVLGVCWSVEALGGAVLGAAATMPGLRAEGCAASGDDGCNDMSDDDDDPEERLPSRADGDEALPFRMRTVRMACVWQHRAPRRVAVGTNMLLHSRRVPLREGGCSASLWAAKLSALG